MRKRKQFRARNAKMDDLDEMFFWQFCSFIYVNLEDDFRLPLSEVFLHEIVDAIWDQINNQKSQKSQK